MRDPNRIARILHHLKLLWQQVPDQRLGQLMHNLTGEYDNHGVEDERLEDRITRFCNTYGLSLGHTYFINNIPMGLAQVYEWIWNNEDELAIYFDAALVGKANGYEDAMRFIKEFVK